MPDATIVCVSANPAMDRRLFMRIFGDRRNQSRAKRARFCRRQSGARGDGGARDGGQGRVDRISRRSDWPGMRAANGMLGIEVVSIPTRQARA